MMRPSKLVLFFFITAALASGQSIPVIKAKALDNSEIILPSPGSPQFLILIVGFSRNSGKVCEVWSKKISADYQANPRINYFSLPVLESAPKVVRPMIVYGMRKGVPIQELHHLVPLYSNESEWKKLVNFSNPDDAYLIVAAPNGDLLWQAHGSYSDAIYSDFQQSVARVLENASTPGKRSRRDVTESQRATSQQRSQPLFLAIRSWTEFRCGWLNCRTRRQKPLSKTQTVF